MSITNAYLQMYECKNRMGVGGKCFAGYHMLMLILTPLILSLSLARTLTRSALTTPPSIPRQLVTTTFLLRGPPTLSAVILFTNAYRWA